MKKTLSGNLAVKILLMIALLLASVGVYFGGVLSAFLIAGGAYGAGTRDNLTEYLIREMTYLDIRQIFDVMDRYAGEDLGAELDEQLQDHFERSNLAMDVLNAKGEVLLEYGEKGENPILANSTWYHFTTMDDDVTEARIRLYVNGDFPYADRFRTGYFRAERLWFARYEILWGTIGLLFLAVLLFVCLMCSAGHRNGIEGIAPSMLRYFPMDLLVLLYLTLISALLAIAMEGMHELAYYMGVEQLLVIFAVIVVMAELLTLWFLMEVAVRVKNRTLFQSTWTYKICAWCLRLAWKIVKWFLERIRDMIVFFINLLKGIPTIPGLVALIITISTFEFIGLILMGRYAVFPWFLEKLVTVPLIMLWALRYRQVQQGLEKLAKGEIEHKEQFRESIPFLKKDLENLNHIGDGINSALADRMRSEHLKTELITNVSHDLKTPLTSIINYADLLSAPGLQPEQVAEYSEVLSRQSNRLKKLLDDLLEASKATTGNLENHPEKCQVGVLLEQAFAEYQQRFEEKNLKPVLRGLDEEVCIWADGRHLWRVFDNLLTNICKYAQNGTRVFLSQECSEQKVLIIFRNTSASELEVSVEELFERFVRGDKSRNTEGNGLGLSIAKSLVELQNGRMDIAVDGDLFKVTLEFRVYTNT